MPSPQCQAAFPFISALCSVVGSCAGLLEAVAIPQAECFEAATLFAKTEGILPAPESSHAIAAAVREANYCKCVQPASGEPGFTAAVGFGRRAGQEEQGRVPGAWWEKGGWKQHLREGGARQP